MGKLIAALGTLCVDIQHRMQYMFKVLATAYESVSAPFKRTRNTSLVSGCTSLTVSTSVISCHLVSSCVISCQLVSSHVISCNFCVTRCQKDSVSLNSLHRLDSSGASDMGSTMMVSRGRLMEQQWVADVMALYLYLW